MCLYRSFGKRLFDIVLGSLLLIGTLPLMVLVAVAVVCCIGRPVLFRQMRPGLNGHLFSIRKFRTMREAFDQQGQPLTDQARRTRFGTFLRSTSLDELPELLDVVAGKMSLVGPRPLLPQYLKRYSPEQARRHEVRPGITGWAQINGRNAISWEEKFRHDVWYVDNLGFWLDLKILWLTFWKTLRRESISAEGEATMPEFTGSDKKEKG